MRVRQAFAVGCLLSLLGAPLGCHSKPDEPDQSKKTSTTASRKIENPPAKPELLDAAKGNEQAPATYKAKFTTTKGDFVVEVTREWSPKAADRFYNLVRRGFFEDIALFRVMKNFVVQFGIHGNPKVAAAWRGARLQDEPRTQPNKRGTITFAKGGPNSRTTQVFINYKDNVDLDKMGGFPPFGKVIEGMDVVDSFFKGYGGTPSDQQAQIQAKGNVHLLQNFPKLDYIESAAIVK